MGNFCKSCHSWEKGIFTRAGESFGLCHNVAVATKVVVDGNTVLGEDGSIYTEEYFGCVYWRENRGSLIDTSKIIKENLAAKESVCKTCGATNSFINKICIKCQYPL